MRELTLCLLCLDPTMRELTLCLDLTCNNARTDPLLGPSAWTLCLLCLLLCLLTLATMRELTLCLLLLATMRELTLCLLLQQCEN